ncbi:MAG TPA: hypothetical protein DCR24_02995 [Bacillus bacterium]|nr:hypothetical protein [Bacillus sp. (in: firmicutes)]
MIKLLLSAVKILMEARIFIRASFFCVCIFIESPILIINILLIVVDGAYTPPKMLKHLPRMWSSSRKLNYVLCAQVAS